MIHDVTRCSQHALCRVQRRVDALEEKQNSLESTFKLLALAVLAIGGAAFAYQHADAIQKAVQPHADAIKGSIQSLASRVTPLLSTALQEAQGLWQRLTTAPMPSPDSGVYAP